MPSGKQAGSFFCPPSSFCVLGIGVMHTCLRYEIWGENDLALLIVLLVMRSRGFVGFLATTSCIVVSFSICRVRGEEHLSHFVRGLMSTCVLSSSVWILGTFDYWHLDSEAHLPLRMCLELCYDIVSLTVSEKEVSERCICMAWGYQLVIA